MNLILKILFIFILGGTLFSCQKDYDVDLSHEVPIGTNHIYIDGELRNFINSSFFTYTHDGKPRLIILFDENINNGEINTRISATSYEPINNYKFNLTNKKSNFTGDLFLQMFQTYDNDLSGWRYEYIFNKDNYFILEQFDTINNVISGKANLTFNRTKKNGAPGALGIDKCVEVHIVFHDFYKVF